MVRVVLGGAIVVREPDGLRARGAGAVLRRHRIEGDRFELPALERQSFRRRVGGLLLLERLEIRALAGIRGIEVRVRPARVEAADGNGGSRSIGCAQPRLESLAGSLERDAGVERGDLVGPRGDEVVVQLFGVILDHGAGRIDLEAAVHLAPRHGDAGIVSVRFGAPGSWGEAREHHRGE